MTHRKPLKLLATGLAALSLSLALIPAHAFQATYRDITGSAWYAKSVAFCEHYGLMDGTSDTAFQPASLLTRAALAEALYRLAGSPAPEGEEQPFTDVGPDHPSLAAIRWAKENGVVAGYPDGSFGPQDPITREQIAVLLWNQQGQAAPAAGTAYGDQTAISDWALPAVAWANEVWLMSGNENNQFLPLNSTTRGEGAVIIANYARFFYGLADEYPLPEAQEVPAVPYDLEGFQVDGNGYMTYSGYYRRGLDVSAHQKEIDWTRVAAAGMEFAMIRAGYRGYTWGTMVKDAYFDYNIQNALANGLEVGVYFFSQALTPEEAAEEAYQLLEWIQDYNVTYPVVFDWEEIDRDDSRSQDTDGNTVTACARVFCEIIEEAGYIPMTYGSPSKVNSGGLLLDRLQDYPAFWLAHYTRNLIPSSFQKRYDIWQYSSTGRVDGISGNVDLNICLTDWSDWRTPEEPEVPEEPEQPEIPEEPETPEEPEEEYPWWMWPI